VPGSVEIHTAACLQARAKDNVEVREIAFSFLFEDEQLMVSVKSDIESNTDVAEISKNDGRQGSFV
jgi:hypothetical protein